MDSFCVAGPRLRFKRVNGVVERCVVGYTGGVKPNPTYHAIGDHTEAVLIEYNPDIVTFEDLLLEWSQMHSPTRYRSTQYRSAIWYTNNEEKETAQNFVVAMKSAQRGYAFFISIEPATRFYRAEEYHEDFLSKRNNVNWV